MVVEIPQKQWNKALAQKVHLLQSKLGNSISHKGNFNLKNNQFTFFNSNYRNVPLKNNGDNLAVIMSERDRILWVFKGFLKKTVHKVQLMEIMDFLSNKLRFPLLNYVTNLSEKHARFEMQKLQQY